jgi:GTPase
MISKIRYIQKPKSVHQIVEHIARNLAEIDIIKYITISKDYIKASSEVTTGRIKIPITKIDHLTAVGVTLLLELDYNVIQFYEMNSPVKGYGSKMVDAVINALPEDWSAAVVMDWSGGFWDKMREKYDKIVIL